ncbi:MAG TPA: hypothetical protein VFF95_04360 [Candidatus Binatus sp.]|nr:hypothetical protein [Candidatus Binatus sp.]
MQRLIDDPEAALRRAADHVLKGYAWFYSDRNITVPAAAILVRLADEILAERIRWMAILARN